MAETTIVQAFGDGASISNNNLVIPLANLPRLDLPNANLANQADRLVVGLALLLQSNLTETAFNADIDRSVYISQGFPNFTVRGTNNSRYRIDQLTINLAKLDDASLIDPDQYG